MAEQKSQGNPNFVVGAMIVGAIIFAAMGTWMPGALDLTGPDTTIMRLTLYGMAVADVAVALFLRAQMRKARRGSDAKPGGTVQRQ
jgi:hypothetical protein